MAPPSDGGPSEAESQNRRIPPTPVCRDEVGLTSWLGKPLHLPARREQVWVLRLTLEFRMLPCIRGCRLTGLVTSRISRCGEFGAASTSSRLAGRPPDSLLFESLSGHRG